MIRFSHCCKAYFMTFKCENIEKLFHQLHIPKTLKKAVTVKTCYMTQIWEIFF